MFPETLRTNLKSSVLHTRHDDGKMSKIVIVIII
jgi:hypothetical protein